MLSLDELIEQLLLIVFNFPILSVNSIVPIAVVAFVFSIVSNSFFIVSIVVLIFYKRRKALIALDEGIETD